MGLTKGFQPLIHSHAARLFGHPAGCFHSPLAHLMGSVCSSKNLPSLRTFLVDEVLLWLKKKPTACWKQHNFVAGRFWGARQQCLQAVWHIDICTGRHLHGLCQQEACTHCTHIVTELAVRPPACPGFQRSVLYTLCHGSVLCMSTFVCLLVPSNVADESLICDMDLLSSQASFCWHQAEVKSTAAQFGANNRFLHRVLFGSGCSVYLICNCLSRGPGHQAAVQG